MRHHAESGRVGLAIFDGDDTLWSTQELYDEAKRRFAALLDQVPEPAEAIIRELDTFDAARAKVIGYPRTRFRDSMLTVYRHLCDRYGLPLSEAAQATIARLGDELFDVPPKLYPDVVDALGQLRHHYRLALVTKGDPEVQQARFVQTHMERFFERPIIVSRKTPEVYLAIIDEFAEDVARTWVIGNSAVSDINPALAAGIRAILINRQTWLHEEGALEHGDVTVARSLAEASVVMQHRDSLVGVHAAVGAD